MLIADTLQNQNVKKMNKLKLTNAGDQHKKLKAAKRGFRQENFNDFVPKTVVPILSDNLFNRYIDTLNDKKN